MLDSLITIVGGLNRMSDKKDDGLSQMTFGNSLVDFTKPARVEAITMIDSRLQHVPEITDVLMSTVNIFSGYYLQAVSLMINVGKVDVIKMLDRLNPSRDPLFNTLTLADQISTEPISFEDMDLSDTRLVHHTLSLESYKTQLPMIGKPIGMANYGSVSLENGRPNQPNQSVREGKEIQMDLNTNLSVGKQLSVTLGNPADPATIMVNVRLISTIVPSTLINGVVDHNSRDLSFSERWDLWRSGQIGFWKDLVMCQDLIDEHKKVLNKDTNQVFGEILKRRRNNSISALFSNSSSVATSSNIMIMSSETRKEIERKHGFKLRDNAPRAKIFNETYLMLLIEVDPEMEHVTIYHRNIDLPTQLTFRQLKTANKAGSGPDVGEILKAYRLGSNPTAL